MTAQRARRGVLLFRWSTHGEWLVLKRYGVTSLVPSAAAPRSWPARCSTVMPVARLRGPHVCGDVWQKQEEKGREKGGEGGGSSPLNERVWYGGGRAFGVQARSALVCSRRRKRGLKRAGFSREVNWVVVPNKRCRCVWVHTFRAPSVDPAILWSGNRAAGYLGSEELEKTGRGASHERDGLICRKESRCSQTNRARRPALFARYLAHVHFLT